MIDVVYKYPLSPPLTDLVMPDGATLLHVHDQNGEPTLWALVDPAAPPRNRQLMVIGTGWQAQVRTLGGDPLPYVGTAHCDGLVWHVFDGGWAP